MLFISPRFIICGNFSFNTLDGNGAISENHLKSNPSGFQATEAASIPEHILPTVFIIAPSPFLNLNIQKPTYASTLSSYQTYVRFSIYFILFLSNIC